MIADFFSTRNIGIQKQKLHQFSDVVSQTYFALNVQIAHPDTFEGSVYHWQLGDIGLSCLHSEPASYQRIAKYIQKQKEESFLMTLPVSTLVRYQRGKVLTECPASYFLLELSHEPYIFSYNYPNRLWVIKIPYPVMENYLRNPERYVAMYWQSNEGVGELLRQYLHICTQQLKSANEGCCGKIMGKQILELSSHMIQQNSGILQSTQSSVRHIHLQRIEHYIMNHFYDHHLTPKKVADACYISVRYLHDLFSDTDTSFSRYLKNYRLKVAYDELNRNPNQKLIEVAYRYGFSDQAQFSRAFKQQYGYSPKEIRADMRMIEKQNS